MGTDGGGGPALKPGMTWYKDVLPIVQNNCQGCHVQGGIGPFPILTYNDGVQYASLISAAVVSKTMPPWKPAADCQSFLDARVLTDDQISTVYSWVKEGTPAGNPADAPMAPPPAPGLTSVDRSLSNSKSYTPAAGLSDDYHCYLLDPKITQAQTLTGFNVVPGVAKEVHHVVVYSLTAAELAKANTMYPDPTGYTCFGGPSIAGVSPKLMAAWVPGSPATIFPTGTGIPLTAGTGLVMQVHYNEANGVSPDTTTLQLQLTSQAVAHPATLTQVAQTSFTIPPMTSGYSVSASVTSPAVTLWGVVPHMHLLGQDIKATITPPGGATSCLIDIPSWDFHWQQFYFYANPSGIPIQAGSTLKLSCTYNNTTSSPVSFGEKTTDEMCLSFFYVTN
jgi:hypothetical protein